MGFASDDSRRGRDDLHIAVRRDGAELSSLIRVELRYHSGSLQASRVFDRVDARYGGSSAAMLSDAMALLFAELRYRMKSGADFTVWYAEPVDMQLVEQAAARHAATDETLTKYVDGLVQRGQVRE